MHPVKDQQKKKIPPAKKKLRADAELTWSYYKKSPKKSMPWRKVSSNSLTSILSIAKSFVTLRDGPSVISLLFTVKSRI
ncbi:MAG: hypothetical protein AMJ45_06745 [Syntrophobacter sp. DG_60]|nr:MAG: hypothetical protein AMJ45_06745 [Syntrophobacter sp. DG_60]